MACTATCGSSAQAWTHRSPPLRAVSRLSPGNFGRSTSASGRPSGRAPNRLVEQRRAEADRERQPGRASGPAPRRCRPAGPRPDRRTRPRRPLPGGHPPRPPPSSPSAAATNSSRSSVFTSNAAKCSRSCTGVAMPAWCAPWNGTAAPVSAPAGSTSSPYGPSPPHRRPRRRRARARHRPSRSAHARRDGSAELVSRSCAAPYFDDGGGELGQRLRQGVDRVRQLLAVGLADLVVRGEVVRRLVRAVLVQQLVQRRELLVELGDQPGVVLLATGFSSSYAFWAPSTLALKSTRSVCE